MGKSSNMFDWPPVSHLLRWEGEEAIFETQRLDALAPDRGPGIQAATNFLAGRCPDPEIVEIRVGLAVPLIAIGIILAAVIITASVFGR